LIWLDGRLIGADAPHLSVSDRGFQLGDGIFETARARRGVVIELDEHLERLRESADATAIPLTLRDEELAQAIHELLTANHLGGRPDESDVGDASIRITVSRGATSMRGLLPARLGDLRPTVAIQAWPHLPPARELVDRGVSAISSAIRRDPRSPLAGIKSTSRADYVYARLEAVRAGADDALFLTTDGSISEATTANVVLIAGSRLRTPPRSAAILAGVTRGWLIAHAESLGYAAEEVNLRPEDLLGADEALLCSSVAGIVPLTRFDGRPIGAGRSGSRTQALRAAREDWIEATSRALASEDTDGPPHDPGPAPKPGR